MDLINLTLLDIFPLTTRPQLYVNKIIAELCNETLPNQSTYSNPVELLQSIIENDGHCEASCAVKDMLSKSKIYKEWQNIMPNLSAVQNIWKFRNKHHDDLSLVDSEILTHGGFLNKGQILYRGGRFGNKTILINDGPISTTLAPDVARWHAIEIKAQLAILRIAEANSVKAFAYSSSGNQKHKEEYEILLQNNIELHKIKEHKICSIEIYEYDVYCNNG